ncbi:flavin reductase family protein [Streptomyces sp. NBC_00124]|nr:flavin reductase family protein [Streptomyces sp. NBC_00124]MCX5360233.1 flavin reductase family protein [Streptomyces sp. NBC_00124]
MTVVRPIIGPALLRSVAGRFPTGVTVITTSTSTGPAGFTCQSFTSLSLDPPLISFNVSRSSDTWPLVREAGTFCVNVLAADQQDTARALAAATPTASPASPTRASWATAPHVCPAQRPGWKRPLRTPAPAATT